MLRGEEGFMSLMLKYKKALELTNEYKFEDLSVEEGGGKLQIKGTAPYEMDKNLVWDAIKENAGWEGEIAANIKVANADIYGRYTVKAGDSLSKIAAKVLDKPGRYTEIFENNKDILKNPDVIHPGQVLKIPRK
jgi:nucleoid-associated protein YgaU